MLASLSQPVGSLLPPTEGTCFLLPGVLSPQECRAWIAAAEARGFEPTGGAYPPSYRDNDRLVQDDPGLAAALFARVAPHLPTHLERDGSVWRLAGLNPRFRACRYRRGQRFGVHRDGPHVAGPDLRSFLTCMLYLTDQGQHAGGATVFHRDRAAQGPPLLTVVPREGAMLVFGHDLWHEGQAVPDGTKYVLRSDVLYARHTPQRAPAAPAPCQVLRGHAGYVWRLLADPAGGLLSAGRDGAVLSWDPRALEGAPPPPLARQAGSVTALARCADGALWTGSRATIRSARR